MERKPQFDLLLELLRKFDEEGILQEVMLVGSWCLFFYRSVLWEDSQLPAVRTLDADFLIPHQRTLRREVDVPSILKALGFVPTIHPSSHWVVYDHPELRVEFLVPELGRGHDEAREIRKLHITAQRLRYLNLLADYPRNISWRGLSIRVPEPAAFALQKLIVSARRSRDAKRQKDLEAALALLDYILPHPEERARLEGILQDLPKGWLKTLRGLAQRHYPGLTEAGLLLR